MDTVVDFLMINSVSPIDNYFEYAEILVKELITRCFINHYEIIHPSTDFDESMPEEAISETAYIIRFIDKNKQCWQLEMEVGTYTSSSQLRVTLLSDGYKIKVEDNYLEQLKLVIKNALRKDWEKIIWLIDKDSELLSVTLYPLIYRTENLVRQMINEIMTKEYGIEWWGYFVPIQIRNKHHSRMSGYKAIAPSFANVDERLMSIDIGDLNTIIKLTEKKWVPSYNVEINDFLNNHKEINSGKIMEILSSQLVETKNLWAEQFSKYLSSDFLSNLKEFEANRNHIVHNKLIDRTSFAKIQKSIQKVENELATAISEISKVVISAEQREATVNLINLKQQEEDAALLEIMESEAGVRIRNSEEIVDLFDEQLCEFHSEFQANLRFRNDIEISEFQNISLENASGTLFSIAYKITDIAANVEYSLDIIKTIPFLRKAPTRNETELEHFAFAFNLI